MRTARAGQLLLGLGVLVGVAAGVGLLLGFEPARLPPALLNIAAYKLTFIGALGLIAAGAIVGRYARREASWKAGKLAPAPGKAALGEGESAFRAPDEKRESREGAALRNRPSDTPDST
jgi:hypothetical protein